MKRLLLLRHAKSSWDDETLNDHERPLNDRGLRDAPRIGQIVTRLEPGPSCIVCSTAVRACETLQHTGLLDLPHITSTLEDSLYHASPKQLWNLVVELSDDVRVAMFIGHNPGLEDFISGLTNEFVRMPTAALALLDFDVEHWREAGPRANLLQWEAWRPKELDI